MRVSILSLLAVVCLVGSGLFADHVDWTDWTAATTGASGTATGHIDVFGGPTIGVTYTGDVAFAQLGSGTNYWIEPNPSDKPYTDNPVVGNAPPPYELIALNREGITNTITLSQAVFEPIMAIVSQGQPGLPVSYDFNRGFQVLSEGQGYWGNGTYELLPGDILRGRELHAAIQFDGWVSSITWTSDPAENWHGFTIGVVPEPSSLGLAAFGLAGLLGRRRRRR